MLRYFNISMWLSQRFKCTALSVVHNKENKKVRDSKGVFAAVLTGLFKAFDCISHELLLAKLHAYGFDKILTILTFMHAFLSQRQQKTKVGFTFSKLTSIFLGVPQRSILGPLLFIIYICDFFSKRSP